MLNYHIVRIVLGSMSVGDSVWLGLVGVVSVLQAEVVLQTATRIPLQPKPTESPTQSNQEQHDQCGNSTESSPAPDDAYINIRNMLST